jgi:hypothetical protein
MIYCAATITMAVIVTFNSANGSNIFHPNRMT